MYLITPRYSAFIPVNGKVMFSKNTGNKPDIKIQNKLFSGINRYDEADSDSKRYGFGH